MLAWGRPPPAVQAEQGSAVIWKVIMCGVLS
jgi:hypothetical protein